MVCLTPFDGKLTASWALTDNKLPAPCSFITLNSTIPWKNMGSGMKSWHFPTKKDNGCWQAIQQSHVASLDLEGIYVHEVWPVISLHYLINTRGLGTSQMTALHDFGTLFALSFQNQYLDSPLPRLILNVLFTFKRATQNTDAAF